MPTETSSFDFLPFFIGFIILGYNKSFNNPFLLPLSISVILIFPYIAGSDKILRKNIERQKLMYDNMRGHRT